MFRLLSHRHLAERWNQRRAPIAAATGRVPPERLVGLPETVVLAEIFYKPDWRRRIATASRYEHIRFYLHVAHRLGMPAGFAAHFDVSGDPLRNWVDQHRPAQRRAAYTERRGPSKSSLGEDSMSVSPPRRQHESPGSKPEFATSPEKQQRYERRHLSSRGNLWRRGFSLESAAFVGPQLYERTAWQGDQMR
ncbi:MAG: hypothetical protein K0U76_10860 [Actinomycetia bacterium]|nr:hypothetical protein [Actinomycetes bacterium]